MAGQAKQGLNFELSLSAPGMWQFPTNPDLCCIYRVPDRIRQLNPKAYTPQLLILGPLHHSLKVQASKRRDEDIENTRFMGYLSMEQHKKSYLSAFAQRFDEEDIIAEFRSVIEEEEENIRASYSESTTWIQSKEFVEMILQDSVFILEFILRYLDKKRDNEHVGDVLMQEISLHNTVYEDLLLLENQLPYFILEKLFDPIIEELYDPIIEELYDPIIKDVFVDITFRKLVFKYFGLEGKMSDNSKFKHFTDLFRCVRVDSLKLEGEGEVSGPKRYKAIENMYNADKLHNVGIKFKAIEEELSLVMKFENGCLELPTFMVSDRMEITLRNIMALEQCHYPYQAYVCSFIDFFDFLINTDKDVDILVEKGVVKNWIGDLVLVANVVNKLSLGIIDCGSYYYDIAFKIEAHYKNRINKSCALLNRVYFKDPWTGTATIAAAFLLFMTLSQTITSIIQVLQKK